MSPIPLGILAGAGKVPFIASGGTLVSVGNFRYHIFYTSGTFTVTQGEMVIHALTIDGGNAGGLGGIGGGSTGGGGGSGGAAVIGPTSSPVNSNLTITVGGASSPSSISQPRIETVIPAPAGAAGAYVDNYGGVAFVGTDGGSLPLYNTRGTPWTSINLAGGANSGGGAGSAAVYNVGTGSSGSYPRRAPGNSGYNTLTAGAVAQAHAAGNTGGGGGGGDVYTEWNFNNRTYQSRGPAGNGGSGIVILAYSIV